MNPVLVLFATRAGYTRKIAEHIAGALEGHNLTAQIVDAKELPSGFSLKNYCAAVISASVHVGKHEHEVVKFVKRHRAELEAMPTAFVSVSLSEASVEDATAPVELRSQSACDVQMMIDGFLRETGWHPNRIKAVAGALLYTKYNLVLRFIMKRIARQAGAATDTTKDYQYTNWTSLDQFVGELAESLAAPAAH